MMPEERNSGYSRRVVLSSLSGAAVAGGISTGAVGDAEAKETTDNTIENIEDIKAVGGQEKDDLLYRAKSDDDLNRIMEKWTEDGFSPRFQNADVWKTIRPSGYENNYTVQVPFGTPQDGGDASIIWSSADSVPTVGNYYPNGSSSNDTNKIEVVTYKVNNSEIVTESATFDPDKNRQIQIQANCVCGDWDIECIAATAAAVAAGGKSCSACAATVAKWECISCAGALVSAGITMKDCCDSGWTCLDPDPILPPTPF